MNPQLDPLSPKILSIREAGGTTIPVECAHSPNSPHQQPHNMTLTMQKDQFILIIFQFNYLLKDTHKLVQKTRKIDFEYLINFIFQAFQLTDLLLEVD